MSGIEARLTATSRATQQTGAAAETAITRMNAAFDRFRQSNVTLQQSQSDLSRQMVQTGNTARVQENAFERLYRQYQQGQRQIDQTAASFQRLSSVVQASAAAFGVTLGAAGLVQFTRQVLEAGVAMERLEARFTAVRGSGQGAREEFAFIQQEATRLGLELTGTANAYSGVLAAGLRTSIGLRGTREVFLGVAEAAASLQLSAADVEGILLAVQQIMSKGVVSAEELRLQIGERLPGAFSIAAEAMGVTERELSKLLQTGSITADVFLPRFARALRDSELVQQGLAISTQSTTAAANRLANAWNLLMAEIARSGPLQLAAGLMENLARQMGRLTETRTPAEQSLQGINAVIGSLSRQAAQVTREMEALQRQMDVATQFPGAEGRIARLGDRYGELFDELQRINRQIGELSTTTIQAGIEPVEEFAAALSLPATVSPAYAKLQEDIRAVMTEFEAGQARIDRLSAALGDQFKAADERAKLLRDTITKLAELDVKPTSPLIQGLLRDLNMVQAAAKLTATELEQLGDALRRNLAEADQLARDLADQELARLAEEERLLADLRRKELEGIRKVNEQRAAEVARIEQEAKREEERLLDERRRSWELFANDVENIMARAFRDIGGFMANFWQRSLDVMLDLFARFAARIATQQIVIPIATQFLGGLGAGLGPGGVAAVSQAFGLSESLFSNVLDLTGLARLGSLFGSALNSATTFFSELPVTIGNALGLTVYPSGFIGPVPTSAQLGMGTTVVSGINTLGALGGLAGIGGGIFSALSASNTTSMGFGAAGAAAGLSAVLASLSLIPSIFTPIGLALSALLPLIGGLFSGHGPIASFGTPRLATGAGITTTPEGQLSFTGGIAVGTESVRMVDVAPIQEEIQNVLTESVNAMVELINAIALDPAALAVETQAALEATLDEIIRINSANKNKMSQEIAEQTRLAQQQMIAGLLGPAISAFGQLQTAAIDEQIRRLPESTAALVAVLNGLNQSFAELQQAENSDVRRQLDWLRQQIDQFAANLVNTTVAIATSMVDTLVTELNQSLPLVLSASLETQLAVVPSRLAQSAQALASLQATEAQLTGAGLDTTALTDQIERLTETIITDTMAIIGQAMAQGAMAFDETVRLLLSIPPQIAALDPDLQRMQQGAQAFAAVVIPLGQQIDALEAATQPLAVIVNETVTSVDDLVAQIRQAGDNISVVLPLYDQLAQAILQQAAVAQQVANDMLAIQQVLVDAAVASLEDLYGTASALQLRFDLLIPQLQADFARAVEGGTTTAELEALANSAEELLQLGQDAVAYGRQLAEEAARLREESEQAARQAQAAQDRLLELEEEWKALEEQYFLDSLREQTRLADEAARQAEELAEINRRQLEQVRRTLRAEATPVDQLAQIEAQLAPLEASLEAGTITPEQMDELIALNEELIRLGQQTNRLDLVAEGMEHLLTAETYLATMQPQLDAQAEALRLQAEALAAQLEAVEAQQEQAALAKEQARIQAEIAQAQADIVFYQQEAVRLAAEADAKQAEANVYIETGYYLQQEAYDLLKQINDSLAQQLYALTGTTDANLALISIQAQALAELQQIQAALYELYRLEYYAVTGVVLTFQRGGLVHAQQGRMIMAEPGELVYTPQTRADTAALARVNAMIPRFQVGGSGEGDSVPLWVPSGSFVLNRSASRAVSGGYQAGGLVGSGSSSGGITITVDLRGASFRSAEDGRQIVELLRRELRQIGGDLGTYLGMRR